ncbi:MAG: YceI family protein [Pseudomonadota bacterium]
MRFAALALAASFIAAPALQAAESYVFDPGHTQVRATWNHAGYSQQSLLFRQVEGGATIDFDDPANTQLNVTIPIDGVDTGVEAFDKHLRSADFFELEAHPNATFVSTSVEKTGDSALKITGDLTIKGVTKSIVLDAVVNNSGEHPLGQFVDYYKGEWVGVTATGTITRSEWGLGFGAPITSDEVELFISTEMKAAGG